MSVAVVSSCYGDYGRFVPRWWEAVQRLDPQPDQVIVAGDDYHPFGFDSVVKRNRWRYPQAYYQNAAIAVADTDWVWLLDIDDIAKPDALAGLEDVHADVWQMGYELSDGTRYVVPQLSNSDYFELGSNPYVGTSAIRRDVFKEVGGFEDVALQDWELWRNMCCYGATFLSSGRTHFEYMRHSSARGIWDTNVANRPAHLEELTDAVA